MVKSGHFCILENTHFMMHAAEKVKDKLKTLICALKSLCLQFILLLFITCV